MGCFPRIQVEVTKTIFSYSQRQNSSPRLLSPCTAPRLPCYRRLPDFPLSSPLLSPPLPCSGLSFQLLLWLEFLCPGQSAFLLLRVRVTARSCLLASTPTAFVGSRAFRLSTGSTNFPHRTPPSAAGAATTVAAAGKSSSLLSSHHLPEPHLVPNLFSI